MNPLLNPLYSLPLLKDYILVPGRIKRLNQQQLERYRDKALRRIVKYAYNVPLYHDRYKESGVHPNDINRIKNIEKLPFISKKDLVDNFPDRVIPIGYNKEKAHVICTGGTTGKPVSIYTDFRTMGGGAIASIRDMKFFNLNWRKSKIVHLGNFNPYRIDLIAQDNFQSHIESVFSMKNILNIDVNTPIIDLINKLDKFQPELIISYPAIYQHLAYLKRKGHGKNINPKLLWVGGAILDDYTREYVEIAFKCRLLNIYLSVEAQSTIAFECPEGNWHIHSDLFHVEAVDDNNNLVAPGERGHIVITRLWGRGTPIVRYTGMDDWIRLSPIKECGCGLKTPILIAGVEGRKRANIILPNGKIFPPGAFCFITPVLHNLKTFKVRQYQVVQKKIDEIDVLLVIDEDLRNVGPTVELIIEKIKEIYQKKTCPAVKINVKEVKEIKNEKDARKPPPIVITHVKSDEGYKVLKSKS